VDELRILASLIINSISFYFVSIILHGFHFDSFWSLILAGILLGIANATIKPLLLFISLPLDVVTFGLFLLIVNGLVLEIVAAFDFGFKISSFWDAMVGSVLLSLFSMLITAILFPQGKQHV
jgi:putative membrane protein